MLRILNSGDGMTAQHKVSTKSAHRPTFSAHLDPARTYAAGLAHLCCMETSTQHLDPVVRLSELAAQLGVSVQTLYDLRSQGRGPRGFRVGRELRFRVSEVDAWLAQMEADDAERHP